MTSFFQYKKTRDLLNQKCDLIQQAWIETCTSTELEKFATNQFDPSTNSSVTTFLEQARSRLISDTIEIGIFGEVKRGKSTLINALVGTEVSSMRVTPETAVPVWVESGEMKTVIWFDNGSYEITNDNEYAKKSASQNSANQSSANVLRVVRYVELDWLPEGLRIVDTPGLNDPSLIESYTQRTMAELDRVSAAIFVFLSPPGPAGPEIKLLQELSKHAIDHVFLVCNFYPDIWQSESDRAQVLDYLNAIICGNNTDIATDIVKIYPINAKAGLAAVLNGDDIGYQKSGVSQLRQDLEKFLTDGALKAITQGVGDRLDLAVSIIRSTLDRRESILKNPTQIEHTAKNLENTILKSRLVIDTTMTDVERIGISLKHSIGEILSDPFIKSAQKIATINSATEINAILNSIENLFFTATTRASTEFDRITNTCISNAEKTLFDSFGITNSITLNNQNCGIAETVSKLGSTIGSITSRINWTDVASNAAVGAVGAGIAGGTLLGGSGIALLAAGPVGWVVGAVALGVAGLLGGTLFGVGKNIDQVKTSDKEKILSELREKAEAVRLQSVQAVDAWIARTFRDLESTRSSLVKEQSIELESIKRALADRTSTDHALLRISEIRTILCEI